MKYSLLALTALVAFTGPLARADNFVTITPTGASAAVVANRWAIGSDLAGLGYIGGNSGFPGATATNFFTITGAPIPLTGAPNGFTSYLPTGAATAQGSVGNALTPNTYSGLTYVAENLSLIGPLSFYTIHHRTSGDYLALIQPGSPTVSDQKPMSVPGGPLTGGATGYFALSYAANDAGGWGANLFYYLRTNGTGETIFGSLVPALLSGPTDRWNLGSNRGFTDLAFTSTDLGFGFGPSQFYYLRLDPLTQTTFFGRLNPLTGVATDIQNLGGVYRTLVFTPTNVGYGANLFYSIGRAAQTITFAPIPSHTACDAPFTFVYPVASSGLPVTIGVSGPATVSGNTVTLTGTTGTVVLTATQAGNADFAPATRVQSFSVTACAPVTPPPGLTAQTITFAAVSDKGLCDPTFTVNPTASSGLPVALVVTSGPATISGNTITITGSGAVTLQALQAGNGTFAAATPVSRTFNAAKCAATVTLTNLTNVYFGNDYNALEWIVATTSPAGLPVIITHEGNTSVPAAVRSYTVVGTIDSPIYAGTTTVTLVISADARVAQTVTFGTPAITNHVFGESPFTLNPSASSGLPTVLTVLSGPATVSGNTVTITGAGTVNLQASQSGHILTHFYAATTQSFLVTKAVAPVALGNLTHNFDGSPKSATAVTTPAGLAVTLTYNGSAIPPSAAGSYAVLAVINDQNYQGSATGTLVISSPVPAPIITNNPLTAAGSVGTPFSFAITASGSPTNYTATPLPNGLNIAAATGIISGTPTTAGTTNVLLGVTNAGGTTNATVTITIAVPGIAPVITNNPLTAGATVGTPFNFAITASGSPTSYTASALPNGLSIGASTGIIAGTPTTAGSTSVLIGATNGSGTGNATLLISIAAASSAPIITNNPLVAGATVGTPFNFSITASGSPTSYSASALPNGLTIVTATGAITGTPTTAGSTSVLLGATNAFGTGTSTLTITVAAPGSVPIITNPTPTSAATIGAPFGYTIVASGSPTSFGASGLPPGLIVNSLTGVITGTPTLEGTFLVALSASSAAGTAFSALTITVAAATVPPIITSPTSAPGTVGVPFVTYLITATGLPTTYTATGLPAGLQLNGLTGAINGTPTASGTSLVTLTATNSAGSSTALLTVTIAPAGVVPIITSPSTAAGAAGTPFVTYLIAATGLPTSYSVTGLPAGLSLNPVTGAITGTPTFAGTSVVTLNATNSNGTSTAVLLIVVAETPSSRIVNFSARAVSGPGAQTLIMGFVVSGNGKNLLVRGVGPGLAAYGVANVLADPLLTVFGPTGMLATNDDWQTTLAGQANAAFIAATGASVGAFALASGSRDSALIHGFDSGAYTTSMARANSTTGVALTEIYDLDASTGSRLINVSARMNVSAGEGTLIAGLVIAGNTPKTVLIRGVGPTLSAFAVTGVLADPQITLFSNNAVIAANDNWGAGVSSAAEISAASTQVGAFALVAGSRDAALLVTLQPGTYTVQVTGVGNTTGVALIEIYDRQ